MNKKKRTCSVLLPWTSCIQKDVDLKFSFPGILLKIHADLKFYLPVSILNKYMPTFSSEILFTGVYLKNICRHSVLKFYLPVSILKRISNLNLTGKYFTTLPANEGWHTCAKKHMDKKKKHILTGKYFTTLPAN